MDYEFRVIVEKVAVTSQEVVKRDTVKVYDIRQPTSILELGLRHEEQISLLSKVQNSFLAEQSALIDLGYDACPQCGLKIKKNGFLQSNFHAVFSDHKLRIQKHRCNNPECHWQSTPTTTTVFGTDIHPDLAKLQCEQGALFSYREAQSNLAKLNCDRRRVNNHTRIKSLTNQVGARLSQATLSAPCPHECEASVSELIIQIDGGHIPVKEKGQRSFEALSAVVYPPDKIKRVDKHHRHITQKTCVVSAINDELVTMKRFTLNAAHKQGMTGQTTVTGLADGAKNCWSVLCSLKPHCEDLECILDWFHIGKKFQNVINALGGLFEKPLESVKWTLWHGKGEEALEKLTLLQNDMIDETQALKLKRLHDYLYNNLAYLTDYDARKKSGRPFTSQVAESHIDSLINARHKRKQKMQWTREGAHNVLQIRAKMESHEWNDKWQDAVLETLTAAA